MKGGVANFLKSSKERFGEKYTFPQIEEEYKNSHSKITIVCNDCGNTFQKLACDHITSSNGGCYRCNKNSKKKTYSYSDLVAISKQNIIQFNGEVSKENMVTCVCNIHGNYQVKVETLLKGRGFCKFCSNRDNDSDRVTKLQYTKQKLNEIYGNKFDIDYSDFKNLTSKIKFICKDCGYTFYRMVSPMINGHISGCPNCKKQENNLLKTKTTIDFIEDAKVIHGDKYDYSKTIYNRSSDKVIVTCNECGKDFEIEANSHLQGHGCPYHYNNRSKIEDELFDYIKLIYNGEIVKNDRSVLPSESELDIVIKDKKIAIEVDGIYWHNELNKPKDYHLRKTNECKENGYHLIHIFEDEWKDSNKQKIWKSMLLNQLALIQHRIYARKCQIRNVDKTIGYKFLEDNHLQGKCPSTIMIGLYYNDELVTLMTFGKSRHFVGSGKFEYELLRFCNKLNTNVVGGASKLFKYFIAQYSPKSVVSYADKRWSNGNLYKQLGFELYNESKPSYYYVIGKKRINRYNLRKDVLVKKYGCPQDVSEHQFCLQQKWYRIYDCGCYCFKFEQ